MTNGTSSDSGERKATRMWIRIATFIYGSATLLVIFIALLGRFLNGGDQGEFISIVLAIVLFSIFVISLQSLYRRGEYAVAKLLTFAPLLLLAVVMLVAWAFA